MIKEICQQCKVRRDEYPWSHWDDELWEKNAMICRHLTKTPKVAVYASAWLMDMQEVTLSWDGMSLDEVQPPKECVCHMEHVLLMAKREDKRNSAKWVKRAMLCVKKQYEKLKGL